MPSIRQRSGLLALIVSLVLVAACTSVPNDVEVATGAPIATTAPVGIPVVPTPTPLGIPAVVVPAPIDDTTAPRQAEVPGERSARETTASAEPAAPEPAPDPTATEAPAQPTAAPEATVAPTAVPEPTATPEPTAEPTATAAPTATPEPPAAAEIGRVVTDTGYRPLGQAQSIPLALPVGRIEIIGFHEAGHPGATAINAAGTGVEMVTMDSRSRGTHERSAADIVVPPGEIVVAPATGTVIAANNYILYCKHDDALVYIEPDGWPGWVVKVFHVEGELPAVGTRVVAGVTKIADSARMLPSESQVDELTAEPSWPHVHVEVIDTSVPDTRPPGPGCP